MSKLRVLITGGSGFVGQHLVNALLERDASVTCIQEVPSFPKPKVESLQVDLLDRQAVATLAPEWDWVIHLAGASVPSQFIDIQPVLMNTQMTLNLLEHLQGGRVLLVSSCHVYAPGNVPKNEHSLIIPQGRYGLSKHLIEQMAGHYGRKLDIRIVRPFNHLGPNMRPELVVPSLLKRILEGLGKDAGPVLMNGTNSTRDFIDVADVVQAYLSVLQIDAPEEKVFNVCTGVPRTIRELAETTLSLLGISREVVFTERTNSSDDSSVLIGDPSLLIKSTSWRPMVDFRDSINRMLAGSKFAS